MNAKKLVVLAVALGLFAISSATVHAQMHTNAGFVSHGGPSHSFVRPGTGTFAGQHWNGNWNGDWHHHHHDNSFIFIGGFPFFGYGYPFGYPYGYGYGYPYGGYYPPPYYGGGYYGLVTTAVDITVTVTMAAVPMVRFTLATPTVQAMDPNRVWCACSSN